MGSMTCEQFVATAPGHTWGAWEPARAGRFRRIACQEPGCPAYALADLTGGDGGGSLVFFRSVPRCLAEARVCSECGEPRDAAGVCTPACVAHQRSMAAWYLTNGS